MRAAVVVILAGMIFAGLTGVAPAQDKYALKTADTPAPTELSAPIRSLLAPQSLQVLDPKGEVYCEIWFRKSIPVKATEQQVKNGLTYQEIPETTLIGAIRFPQEGRDYRKQKVKAGVYTLRFALQPQDGDHMGTAAHPEFCLIVAAEKDTKPDLLEPKQLQELSAKTMGGSHPGPLLLFPAGKADAAAKLADQGTGHWVIKQVLQAEANGKPVPLGIGLTIIGTSPAA